MNRQLSCNISKEKDSAIGLAAELVQHGFIHEDDSQVRNKSREGGENGLQIILNGGANFIFILSLEGVILFIIIWDVHQFIVYCLIGGLNTTAEPWDERLIYSQLSYPSLTKT